MTDKDRILRDLGRVESLAMETKCRLDILEKKIDYIMENTEYEEIRKEILDTETPITAMESYKEGLDFGRETAKQELKEELLGKIDNAKWNFDCDCNMCFANKKTYNQIKDIIKYLK